MRQLARILAALILAATLIAWVLLGAHWGWSQTRVTTMQTDPITEIQFPVYEDRFVPGVDFLGAGVVAALALFSISFLLPKTQSK